MNEQKDKTELLKLLYKKYEQCNLCPLAQQGRKNIVFGSGNPYSKIMLIGEAPGKEEDLQAIPFVGRSGALLTNILSLAHITRDDVFISNIVKCRPPHNRKPKPIETQTCMQELLLQEIDIIQPFIICTLGATALNGLIGQKIAISKERGKIIKWNNYLILPTLHPAFILRNQTLLPFSVQDFQLANLYSKQS